MISKRAKKLQTLCADASAPNSYADRLIAISRAANRSDVGRPTRSYMLTQLQEIESKNIGYAAVISRILAIREKFSTNRAIKKRRLERKARTEAEMQPIAPNPEPAPDATEPAPTDESSAAADEDLYEPKFVWPPMDIQFPPPAGLYEMGSVDMAGLADRLRRAGLKGHPPGLTSDELNEKILRTAIGQPLATITLDLLQQIYLSLEYERKAEDRLMPGDRFRFWPFVYLLGAVTYLAQQRFGYGSLKKAPPSPDFIRALLQKPKCELAVFDRLETIPELERRAKQYAYLEGFKELIEEFNNSSGGNNATQSGMA